MALPCTPKLTKKERKKLSTDKPADKWNRDGSRSGGISRAVAGTEQPDALPWRANAAVTPPGDGMAAGNTCYTAHACPFMITSETSHHTLTHVGHTPTHSGTLTQHATHTRARERERARACARERQRERERGRARLHAHERQADRQARDKA